MAEQPTEGSENAAVRRQGQSFEDYTLADVLAALLRQPRETWHQFNAVIRQRAASHAGQMQRAPSSAATEAADPVEAVEPPGDSNDAGQEKPPEPPPHTEANAHTIETLTDANTRRLEAVLFGLRLTWILIAWFGNGLLAAGETSRILPAAVIIGAALLGWIGTELYASRHALRAWWANRGNKSDAEAPRPMPSDEYWAGIHPVRVVLAIIGGVGILLTITFTANNQFTALGFIAWMISITAVAGSLASEQALFERQPVRFPRFWKSWTFYALVLILIVGGYFRLAHLDQTPPQMTSDHVEKLLDSQRVLDGNTQVFFPNNGGREPLQMYLMALMSQVPGLSMDFYTLKLLSALEGLVSIPILWWMGREVVGRENRQFGNIVGLVLAALVAVSHWHVSLSRLALRIVLTPMVAAGLLVYLGRGMRDNNRDDFLRAGLILGAGLYMYQAVRMLPVVVIVGVLIAVIAKARSFAAVRRYGTHFAMLVLVSFIVFIPMFTFSTQYPELFWRRTTGRLLGDAVIEQVNDDGTITMRDATIGERFDAFRENLPVLRDNVVNVLLMFNWKGDVAWINNAPNKPQMDTLVGALFLIGLAAWTIRMFRTRDVVDWLVPAMLFLMLMPSALAIAYPVENPSATRTSGALPVAYLVAAYPLALIVRSIVRLVPIRKISYAVAGLLVGLVALVSYAQNAHTYFDIYHDNYLLSSLPYAQAGEDLQQFRQRVGSDGNAFMIAYPYWWDHRALGIEGGMIDFPNGIISLENVPKFMYDSYLRSDQYAFNPEKDILFFHSPDDTETLQQLQAWFPEGTSEVIEIPEQRRSYAMYRVPPIGTEAFVEFVRENEGTRFGVE